MLRNDKRSGFEHTHSLFKYFQNQAIDSYNTWQKCQNANISIKQQPFLIRGSDKLYSSQREKKKVPVCEILEFSGSLSFPMHPILSRKLKIIAYRGSSTFPTSFKLELFCQYKMTFIVTKIKTQ